jgi:MoaA/NifB/PqqE/SkfB family radical SAM enzyme
MKAMQILKEKHLLFGAACCYTKKNVELIGSDRYFDSVIGWGAKFMWCFSYTPIGKGAETDLMVTPAQREYMYHNIRRLRSEKPLFAMDFYNDAKYVHGCIAGGRSYLHINANGDIEPCAFIHFSPTPISVPTRSWRRCRSRCSWPSITTSRSTTTCSARARWWTIPAD